MSFLKKTTTIPMNHITNNGKIISSIKVKRKSYLNCCNTFKHSLKLSGLAIPFPAIPNAVP